MQYGSYRDYCHTRTHRHTRTHTRIHTHTHADTRTHTHARAHTRTHTRTHTIRIDEKEQYENPMDKMKALLNMNKDDKETCESASSKEQYNPGLTS